MYINRERILRIFNLLEDNNIPCILLRNINNELPDRFEAKKDIDIMVHPKYKKEFHKFTVNFEWKKTQHPWDFGANFIFLYAMDPFEFYISDGIYLDVCYQLSCRSTNNGEWMPIDMMINTSAWDNRIKHAEYGWYELCVEDELVHLITRCVFDKKIFPEGYEERIQYLYDVVNKNEFYKRLEMVFFKFTPRLFEMIKEKDFNEIRREYLTFTNY